MRDELKTVKNIRTNRERIRIAKIMTVKDLKKLLNEIDENLNVVIFDGSSSIKNIKDANKTTFIVACDEKGNLLPDGNNPKYDIDVFVIEV